VLLGAALNSKLALEQVAEAAVRQGESNLLALRRLCSKLLATLRLGETRVKLYGRCVRAGPAWRGRDQPRWLAARLRVSQSRHARPLTRARAARVPPSYNVFTKALRVGRSKAVEDKFDEARVSQFMLRAAQGPPAPPPAPAARSPAARASALTRHTRRRCARRWRP